MVYRIIGYLVETHFKFLSFSFSFNIKRFVSDVYNLHDVYNFPQSRGVDHSKQDGELCNIS